MGQGAETTPGYELDYDPAYEGLHRATPLWNDSIPVTQMSLRHLKNSLRYARSRAFDSDIYDTDNQWATWVDILESEISERPGPAKYSGNIKKRGKTKRMRCHCGQEYDAREADLKRGYAKSCSKRCASVRREFGRPAGKEIK